MKNTIKPRYGKMSSPPGITIGGNSAKKKPGSRDFRKRGWKGKAMRSQNKGRKEERKQAIQQKLYDLVKQQVSQKNHPHLYYLRRRIMGKGSRGVWEACAVKPVRNVKKKRRMGSSKGKSLRKKGVQGWNKGEREQMRLVHNPRKPSTGNK